MSERNRFTVVRVQAQGMLRWGAPWAQHDSYRPVVIIRRTGVVLALALGLMAALAACMGAPTPEPDKQATVIVQLDDTAALARRVSFTAPISGLVALEGAGLDVVTADMGWGTAVCSIAGVGCPAEDCFCGGDTFWGYANWDGAGWQGYAVGADQSVISATGQVDGWVWGASAPDAAPALIPAGRADAALRALDWLRGQQEVDGGYGGAGPSVEALLALAANGVDATTWRVADGPSLLEYVTANAAEFSRVEVAAAGKLALALSGVDGCWPADALTPSAYYSPTLGALSPDAGPLALGILGSLALAEPVGAGNAVRLTELALPDGGWEWASGWGRDTNSTSLAIQALVALDTPADDPVIQGGLAYLATTQAADGGIAYDEKVGDADANSTAYAVQALLAAGEDPATWAAATGDPLSYLLAAQRADGALLWQAGQTEPNALATQQSVAAFLGRSFPLRAAALPTCAAGN